MRQFYGVNIPDTGDAVVVHFDKPVRKVTLYPLASFISCSVGKTKNSNRMLVMGALQNVTLDFQRANTGKGVEDLTFWRYDGTGDTRLSISVVEYGTDADNAYFE